MEPSEKAHVEHMLACVQESLEEKDQINEFIESIAEQLERRGHLSPKQVAALTKFYDRIVQ